MRLPLLSIRKYNSSNSAKAHIRTFYILTHFIQIYSTFVRQNPAESQSSDLIRKKVFSNKKCFEGFFFSVITVSSTWGGQCRLWEGFLRKYQMSCWFMFLYSDCPRSPLYMYIVQHSLLYNKHKSRPRQIRVNLSFYIIQIWFMLLYYLNIYLFIFSE